MSVEKNAGELPSTYRRFVARFPELASTHEAVGRAAEGAGPLEKRVQTLIKIGICAGAGLESSLRSQVRRATEHGVSRDEIEHAIMLGMNSLGFPRTVAAWQWALQELAPDDPTA